ncbi:MAG: hypothetical protein NTW14_06700 [bacterium]|nr:hypothetical protein [bacterium]
MKFSSYYVAAFFILSVAKVVYSEPARSPIVLRQADLMRTENGPSGPVRYLDGKVWITHDTLSITCEHTRWEETTGVLYFEDKVHFVEPHRKTWAQRAIYYEREDRAIAEGQVRIEQDSMFILCDRAIYNNTKQEALFFGNVEIHSIKENAVITGNHGAYEHETDRGVMSQDPRLVRHFEGNDSLVVIGRIIEYYFKDEYSIVTDSVHVTRNQFEAWAQKMEYWNKDGKTRLLGNPIIKHNRDLLSADSIDAYFENQKLKRVLMFGQADATSPADSLLPKPVNHMTGHTMELTFVEGALDSVYVRGNATSVYYIRENGEKKGANRVSGDLIDIQVLANRVNWIYVEGGTEGTYYPRHLEQRVDADQTADLPPGRRSP